MTPERQHFREVLAQLASKTQARIPTLNGRVAKACKLVLGDDITLNADGSATVASLTDAAVSYTVLDGQCSCKDWQHAPAHLCCHRLSAGLLRKTLTMLPPPAPVTPTVPLPEAPASVNCRAMVGPFEVQVTLRGASEDELLARLQAVLKRPDVKPVPKPPPRGAWRK